MNTKHTAGKWCAEGTGIYSDRDAATLVIADCWSGRTLSYAEGRANAAHIVACVAACEGINPAAVPSMLEALEGLLADKYLADQINAGRMAQARAAIALAKGIA